MQEVCNDIIYSIIGPLLIWYVYNIYYSYIKQVNTEFNANGKYILYYREIETGEIVYAECI